MGPALILSMFTGFFVALQPQKSWPWAASGRSKHTGCVDVFLPNFCSTFTDFYGDVYRDDIRVFGISTPVLC